MIKCCNTFVENSLNDYYFVCLSDAIIFIVYKCMHAMGIIYTIHHGHMENLIHYSPTCYSYSVKKPIGL